MRKHLITYTKNSHFTVLAERPNGLRGELYPKMDHLVCFMPGTIALAATGGLTVEAAKKAGKWGEKQQSEIDLAKELTKTCWGMYKATGTGLAGEITFFEINDPPRSEADGIPPPADFTDASWKDDFVIKRQDSHNLQRPETVETLFYMWRITEDETYREWGWEMFKSFVNFTQAEGDAGYTSVANVLENPPPLRDNMESFWLVRSPLRPVLPSKYLRMVFSLMNHVFLGRDAQILLPALLVYRSPAAGYHRHQHRGAHLPALKARQGPEDGLDEETKGCGREACGTSEVPWQEGERRWGEQGPPGRQEEGRGPP